MNKKHLLLIGVSVLLVALLSLLVFWRVKADRGQQLRNSSANLCSLKGCLCKVCASRTSRR